MAGEQPILYKRDVVELLRLGSPRALDRLIAAGEFPRGRPMGGKRVFWTRADLDAWLLLAGRLRPGPLDEGEDSDEGEPSRKKIRGAE